MHRGRRSRRAAVGGWLIGFYPIESSITAGLCMTSRGGSGDLEVLSACNRMNTHFICTNFLSSGRRYCAGYR